MAKKQSLNYGPNTGLISGARDVAQSEAAMTSVGAAGFAQNFTGAILTGIEEQEKRNSIRDAFLADLKSPQNINLLDEDYNKQAVTSFVRQKRDEYAKFADTYARTKDVNILDKMENIKFSFANLNNQLKGLASERVEYLDAYDKGQIVDIPQRGDSIYTMAYTNKGQFLIDGTGNIGFNIDGKTTMFKDIAGKYNVKSNIGEAFVLEQGIKARNTGDRGGKFYREDTKNIYKFKFKETGPEGIMVMAKTDLTGDDEYTLPNGQKAGNLSFESMWSQGLLDEKFYKAFKAKDGTDWMYEDKNVDMLNDLISEYYTDVTEAIYNPAKQAFDAKNTKTTSGNPTGFLTTKKGVNLGSLGMSFGYNVSKNMYDQFKLSSEGKPAQFTIGQTNFSYDVENDNWIQTKKDGSKKNLGDLNATLGPKGFAIVDPDFLALRTTQEVTEDSDLDFDVTETKRTKSEQAGVVSTWSSKIDMSFVNRDDNVVARELQKLMPTAFDVESNPLGYKFMNLKFGSGKYGGSVGVMGDFTEEAVGLYSDDGKTLITYPEGHEKDVDAQGNPGQGRIPVIIKLGTDIAARKEAIATIDAIVNTPEFKIGKPKLK